jgi:formate dehydrogenase major subunit
VALRWERAENPLVHEGEEPYPLVASTFRLTEHHTAGPMSRNLPWLAELQPEMFMEIDPELAESRGIEDGEWMTVLTARGQIEGRARVTERVQPMRLGDRVLHQVCMPWHWGAHASSSLGVTGDGANELIPATGDPNVSIQESKAFRCDVRAGRREGHP